jgi:hypothetical protein
MNNPEFHTNFLLVREMTARGEKDIKPQTKYEKDAMAKTRRA